MMIESGFPSACGAHKRGGRRRGLELAPTPRPLSVRPRTAPSSSQSYRDLQPVNNGSICFGYYTCLHCWLHCHHQRPMDAQYSSSLQHRLQVHLPERHARPIHPRYVSTDSVTPCVSIFHSFSGARDRLVLGWRPLLLNAEFRHREACLLLLRPVYLLSQFQVCSNILFRLDLPCMP